MRSAATKMPAVLEEHGLRINDYVTITRRDGYRVALAFLKEGYISHVSTHMIVIQGKHYREAFSTSDLFGCVILKKKEAI